MFEKNRWDKKDLSNKKFSNNSQDYQISHQGQVKHIFNLQSTKQNWIYILKENRLWLPWLQCKWIQFKWEGILYPLGHWNSNLDPNSKSEPLPYTIAKALIKWKQPNFLPLKLCFKITM